MHSVLHLARWNNLLSFSVTKPFAVIVFKGTGRAQENVHFHSKVFSTNTATFLRLSKQDYSRCVALWCYTNRETVHKQH